MTFPNYKDKYSSLPVFSSEDAVRYWKASRSENFETPLNGVLLCYSRYLIDYVQLNYDVTSFRFVSGHYLHLFNEYDRKIGIMGNFGIGAPVAVAVLEELITLGIQKFVSLGVAGTLQKYLNIGDIVICNKAIRDEGTSHHYVKSTKYASASPLLTEAMQEIMKKRQSTVYTGTSWTTDAPYRETAAEVQHYQNEGVLTVDMEASALFAVAEFRSVHMGSIFTISDSLADSGWKPAFRSELTVQGLETILKVSLEALAGHQSA